MKAELDLKAELDGCRQQKDMYLFLLRELVKEHFGSLYSDYRTDCTLAFTFYTAELGLDITLGALVGVQQGLRAGEAGWVSNRGSAQVKGVISVIF